MRIEIITYSLGSLFFGGVLGWIIGYGMDSERVSESHELERSRLLAHKKQMLQEFKAQVQHERRLGEMSPERQKDLLAELKAISEATHA